MTSPQPVFPAGAMSTHDNGDGSTMTVADAQAEFRSAYRGGSVGLVVAGLVWAASVITTLSVGIDFGIAVMVGVGFFIYPMTLLGLKILGGEAPVSRGNPLRGLSVEAPLVGPMMLPLVAAAALYRLDWFYPAMMLAIGAHYVPFSSLYGMKMFRVLGAAMAAVGVAIALWAPAVSAGGAAATAVLLFIFAVLGYRSTRNGTDQGRGGHL